MCTMHIAARPRRGVTPISAKGAELLAWAAGLEGGFVGRSVMTPRKRNGACRPLRAASATQPRSRLCSSKCQYTSLSSAPPGDSTAARRELGGLAQGAVRAVRGAKLFELDQPISSVGLVLQLSRDRLCALRPGNLAWVATTRISARSNTAEGRTGSSFRIPVANLGILARKNS